jgi:hypothetical protein
MGARVLLALLLAGLGLQPKWAQQPTPQTDPCFCLDAGGVWFSLPDVCCHVPGRHALDRMDGIVDIRDFLFLVGAWGECPTGNCDINRDGWIDVEDLLVIIEHWGQPPWTFERCRELP